LGRRGGTGRGGKQHQALGLGAFDDLLQRPRNHKRVLGLEQVVQTVTRTSATCLAAKILPRTADTPFPITRALTVLKYPFAIAARPPGFEMALFPLTCRRSVMTRIFTARSPRFKLQFPTRSRNSFGLPVRKSVSWVLVACKSFRSFGPRLDGWKPERLGVAAAISFFLRGHDAFNVE